ncbi:MAG: hypothetical protein EPN39_19540 [Chitinophagaceae bacterium]|jgi:hypothetical protein|nr:MAG: hypothetical protein EPN39_19540 [Chitinophagaceae bacterium]
MGYQNPEVPVSVQQRYARQDLLRATSDKASGVIKMEIALADVVSNVMVAGEGAGLVVKTTGKVGADLLTKLLGKEFAEQLEEKAIIKSTEEAGKVEMTNVSTLNPTYYLTRSRTQMQALLNDIRTNGIRNPIEYVEFNGRKYIVGGNHRYFIAQKLGIQNVPVKQVQLPFAGYKTPADLMLEGKMPGYWKYLK